MVDVADHQESSYIILGGGLAGLFAARILRESGASNIHVIEAASSTGGLMQSVCVQPPLKENEDFYFDYGTHFILGSSGPEVNEILKRDMDTEKYLQFNNSLYEGHYLNGILYEQSGCASIAAMDEHIQQKIRAELAECVGRHEKNKPYSLYDGLLKKYGETATELIFVPAFKKFTGHHPKQLDPSVENFFCASRLIVAGREKSIQLKQDSLWDDRIAFADCRDSTSAIVKYYPKQGGIGFWLQAMQSNLEKEGVHIKTGCTVTEIVADGGYIKAVKLSNGEMLNCRHLIWTLPAIFLARMLKIDVPSVRPVMRSVAAIHYLTDAQPVRFPYWITVFDAQMKTYRITIYDNFAPKNDNGPFRLTAEILHDGDYVGNEQDMDDIFEEIKKMKVLPDGAKKLWSLTTHKKEGFPVVTKELLEAQKKQIETLENSFANLSITGRRPDGGQGQIAIINHTYDVLKKFPSEGS